MRDYAELVKALRYCGDSDRQGCAKECQYGKEHPLNFRCIGFLFADSADAIEELLAAVNSVVKCKDCKWWAKQEASIQGRCARLAIYPTGEFYCASGSKEEPPKEVQDG